MSRSAAESNARTHRPVSQDQGPLPCQQELPGAQPAMLTHSEPPAGEAIDLAGCIRLSLMLEEGGLGARAIRRIAEQLGSYQAVLSLSEHALLDAAVAFGLPERARRLAEAIHLGRMSERAKRLEEHCCREQITAVACTDVAYPERLRPISGMPVVLFCRGQDMGALFQDTGVATVIGTRRPTGYGRLMARRITEPLAQAGILIVSGLARGIDSVAHEAALAAGRPTIGVLACGVDISYPPENDGLIHRICEQGAVISEHVPGTPPKRTYFPARNRILSGLADAVIVVEASLKSGSMITATFAADQGRDVYAVPGNALSRESEGCNRLIRDGAFLLTEAEDVLERLPMARRLDSFATVPAVWKNEPDEDEICNLLQGGSLTLNDLSSLLDESLPELLCRLTDLEVRGRVVRERGRFALSGDTCSR